MAHKLQGMREETVWGQVLGTDIIPQLTAEAAKQVYEVKFTLNGKVKAMRYANRGQTVSLPRAKELAGTDYNPLNTYTLTFADNFSAATTVTGDKTVAVQMTYKRLFRDCFERRLERVLRPREGRTDQAQRQDDGECRSRFGHHDGGY